MCVNLSTCSKPASVLSQISLIRWRKYTVVKGNWFHFPIKFDGRLLITVLDSLHRCLIATYADSFVQHTHTHTHLLHTDMKLINMNILPGPSHTHAHTGIMRPNMQRWVAAAALIWKPVLSLCSRLFTAAVRSPVESSECFPSGEYSTRKHFEEEWMKTVSTGS